MKTDTFNINMKLFASLFIVVAIFSLTLSCSSKSDKEPLETTDTTTKDGFIYTRNDSGVTVTGYVTKPKGRITIPKNVKMGLLKVSVNSIGESVFEDCDSLIAVTMPNISVIAPRAFAECDKLKNVSMPNVKYVGGEAFFDCESLAKVTVPKSFCYRDSYSVLHYIALCWDAPYGLIIGKSVTSYYRDSFGGCLWKPEENKVTNVCE